jgi:hypothetical protein
MVQAGVVSRRPSARVPSITDPFGLCIPHRERGDRPTIQAVMMKYSHSRIETSPQANAIAHAAGLFVPIPRPGRR